MDVRGVTDTSIDDLLLSAVTFIRVLFLCIILLAY